MGITDDAKDALDAAGRKIGRAAEDAKDRIEDKADELKADAKVRQAEAELKHAESARHVTEVKNDLKQGMRGDN